jgi:cytochrome c5
MCDLPCCASGKDGAPKIGDVAAWTRHSKNGLVKLTENAIKGVGKMPAHGGQPSLIDLEMSRAVAFMVSFGKAVDPKKPCASPTSITGEQLVGERCAACHESGKDNLSDTDLRNAVTYLVVQSATYKPK